MLEVTDGRGERGSPLSPLQDRRLDVPSELSPCHPRAKFQLDIHSHVSLQLGTALPPNSRSKWT